MTAVVLLACASAISACGETDPDPRTTVRIGTTTSVIATTSTTVRAVDHSTESSASSGSATTSEGPETGAATKPALTANVAGWKQFELGVPGSAILQGELAFDENRVAWVESALGHDDVFVLDLHTGVKKKVTNSPDDVTAISLEGPHLAWVARESPDLDDPAQLLVYDMDSGKSELITEAPIPPGYMVQVVGDRVAWCQRYGTVGDESSAGRLALYVHSLSKGLTIKVSGRLFSGAWEPNGRAGFDLDTYYIAYVETANLNTDGEVWLFDLVNGTKRHLAHSVAASNHVSLQDELVTWASPGKTPRGAPYPAADVSVYRMNTKTVEKVATITSPEPLPQTDGRYVVWDNYVGDESAGIRVVEGYDSRKDKLFSVTGDAFLATTPEISEGLVVWERGGELDSEVMARDLTTGQTTQLSADASMDQMVRAHGRTVVWLQRWDSEDESAGADASVLAVAPDRFRDTFSDVDASYRYRTAIQAMFDWGLVAGYKLASDRQYHPEEGLSRTDFVQILSDALSRETGVAGGLPADGSGDDVAELTRAEAVSLLVGSLDASHPGLLTSSTSRPPGAAAWDEPYVGDLERAYAGHLLSSLVGWQQPWDASQLLTRAEAAQLIYNAVMLLLAGSPSG